MASPTSNRFPPDNIPNTSRSIRLPARIPLAIVLGTLLFGTPWTSHLQADGQTYRLYEGITVYAHNPNGVNFRVSIDLKDLNLFANGPREVLVKIYDPDGRLLIREIVPDDGAGSQSSPGGAGGWDHEMQYYASLYAKGTFPSFRWSAWSEPARLKTLASRRLSYEIAPGKPGAYRVVLAGTPDNYVTLRLDPCLSFAACGHPNFLHVHGAMLEKAYIFVPKGTSGAFLAAVEPDLPRTRRFKLKGPDGSVLYDGMAPGGFIAAAGKGKDAIAISFPDSGAYDEKLLTLEISPGPGDCLIKLNLRQPKSGPFAEYVGMGSTALFSEDPATAAALRGGTIGSGEEIFWHPFQARFHDWLKRHPLDRSEQERELRSELMKIYHGMRLFETSDGRGSASWSNWAYSFGYYGCRIWRPSWLLMSRADVPDDVKEIIREGLIMGGDRLAFAAGGERVNGNAFAQINVALWYCHRATGDPLQKELFETFWNRWKNEGWGTGSGLSPSGDSLEHFAHDMHYGSYLLDNWLGGTWIKEGIVDDAKDDPRFQDVIDRCRELYSFLYCADSKGEPLPANPWSARTEQSAHRGPQNWRTAGNRWKGEPGPDFTLSVNGGDEWFAARRRSYYILSFHGRLAPEWMSRCFEGQLGFGGGAICQLVVPGRGPVLASTLNGAYGRGMDPSNWRNFHIHSIVGERWDGIAIISGISEPSVLFDGRSVISEGEVRDGRVKVIRTYTYHPDSIACEARLADSDYSTILSIWSNERPRAEMKAAYEMLPFVPDAKVTLFDTQGRDLGALGSHPVEAARLRIDCGGYGVDILLGKPLPVSRGGNHTVLIRLTPPDAPLTPANEIGLTYRIQPYGAAPDA